MEYYILECPHCSLTLQVFRHELNCRIFRHGIYKNTLKQIDPHMPEKDCKYLKENGLIYGCGKPFEIIMKNSKPLIRKCGYI